MSMSEVINSIEREAFERVTKPSEKMSLVEYAESIAPFRLSDLQKELFEQYEQCLIKDMSLYVSLPRCTGRSFVYVVMEEWKNRNELREYRCSCGRFLGKFSGRAEIKCPKCGKVNVIGEGK